MPNNNTAPICGTAAEAKRHSSDRPEEEMPLPFLSPDPVGILDAIDRSLLHLENDTDTGFFSEEETVLFQDTADETGLFPAVSESCICQIPPQKEEFSAKSADETAGGKHQKKKRRRQIDPTTCERDYSNDEVEFMNALDEYKRANNRMFPTCSEILEVLRSLGYVKLPAGVPKEITPNSSVETITPLQSGTPALLNDDGNESEEIVTIFWNQESRQILSSEEILSSAADDDFDYREPLLIF